MKALKWFSLIILFFLITLMASLVFVYYYPQQSFVLMQKYFLPKDLEVSWQNLDLRFKRQNGLDFSLQMDVAGLKIKKNSPELNLPIQNLNLDILLQVVKKKVVIQNLLLSAPETISFTPNPHPTSTQEKSLHQHFEFFVEILKRIDHRLNGKTVKIEVADLELRQPTGLLHLGFTLQSLAASDLLQLEGQMWANDETWRLEFNPTFDLSRIETTQPFSYGDFKFNGVGAQAQSSLQIRYARKLAGIQILADWRYQRDKLNLRAHSVLDLAIHPDVASLKISSDLQTTNIWVPQVKNLTLSLQVPLQDNKTWGAGPSTFSLTAPLYLSFIDKKNLKAIQKSCSCVLPLLLAGKASGQLWLGKLFEPQSEKVVVSEAYVSLENLKNRLFFLELAAHLRVERDKEEWMVIPQIQSQAAIYRFQDLEPLFKKYHVFIPAPFDILKGEILLKANGEMNVDKEQWRFPLEVTVDLTSPEQKIKLASTNTFHFTHNFRKLHVQSKTAIDLLQVELPPLNPVQGTPRIVPDQRILQNPTEEQKSSFEMSFAVEVVTLRPGAVRLLSPYFKPYLPLTVKMHSVQGQSNEGFIRAEPFEIVYLKRKINVEKMALDLNQIENDIVPVDMRMRVQQTIYTVFIDIKGNASNPSVTLSSEPYLPEAEIISVLLYDRTSDQLAAEDVETAGGVRAAVTDRAIGLFGLWAFASTPIRSFSYNPVTKVYTATVALGHDITMGIGTSWESKTQLELRKRVSKNWVLTAKWAAATSDEAQKTKMVLQWERRF